MAAVDLLAPLHNAEPVLKIGGQYDTAPSSTGRTCIRIHGSLKLHWSATANAFEFDDGAYIGIKVGVWPYDTAGHTFPAPTGGDILPVDPIGAANTTDWMFWRRVHIWDDQHVTDAPISATDDDYIGVWEFDVRSKRKIAEMGQTLIFCINPSGSGSQGVEAFEVTTSALLR